MKAKNQIKIKSMLAVCCMAAATTLMLVSCGKERTVEVTDAILSDCLNTQVGKVVVGGPNGTYSITSRGRDIHVVRHDVVFDCGFDTVLVHVSYNKDTIKVFEEPIYPDGVSANCLCTINMDYRLRDLPSGRSVLAFMAYDHLFYDTIINLP
ncbi:MAG: hypothetical protein SPJ13_01370 [Bacteroidales bacterium]|nr:hypothetical protein [Bacteroidales bacterium]